jgi:DNA-binding transcriptional MerR regulator
MAKTIQEAIEYLKGIHCGGDFDIAIADIKELIDRPGGEDDIDQIILKVFDDFNDTDDEYSGELLIEAVRYYLSGQNGIPQDIRSKIAQLDELAGSIKEFFEDFENEDFYDEDFKDTLEELQSTISRYQESKGWI